MSLSPKVEIWDVSKLKPYAANAKVHPLEQIQKLATAIKKFGWTQPIVVWKNGEIIAGHGRRLAAISLGLKSVPVIVRSDLSQAEADALRLADNRVSSTEYDMSALGIELQRLSETLIGSEITLEDLGFDTKELDFTLSDLGEINPDFFSDDVSGDTEIQKARNEKSIEVTDDIAAPITDALGIKRITIAQSRELRTMVGQMEVASGKKGYEALRDILRRGLGLSH